MNYIIDFVDAHIGIILIILSFLILLTLILTLINIGRTNKMIRRYRRLMRGTDNKNLEAMLDDYFQRIVGSVDAVKEMDERVDQLSRQMMRCVQKVAIIRYNPFEQMGSDQSFSIAMLDGFNDGYVLTGLFGRNTSTMFTKPIKGGRSSYALSDEEMEALKMAMDQR